MARRGKPNNGFPSKPLIGVQAERVQQIMLLMASGQWAGTITEIGLAREWDLSLGYVQDLAATASANIQIQLSPEFQSQLRARLFHATQAITATLSEYALDKHHHGEHDRYEASDDGGRTWFEITRKKALEDEYRDAVKIRRVPCAPVGALPSLAQAAFKGMEGLARLAGVEMDPRYLAPGAPGGEGGSGEPVRPQINVHYEGVTEPPGKPEGGPPPAAPAQPG